ncbi:MAG: hypothetical protein KDM63_00730 [Verrucomicrobiae bacterium]|nr:hypothetical protein [Verrucomicrobiae bacterium]
MRHSFVSPDLVNHRLPVLVAGMAALIFGLSSCETTAPSGSAATASPHSPAAAPSLAEGKRLYYGRCTACHAPEPIADYTQSEWREMVAHMRKRAKLTPTEEASLVAYLMANAPAN